MAFVGKPKTRTAKMTLKAKQFRRINCIREDIVVGTDASRRKQEKVRQTREEAEELYRGVEWKHDHHNRHRKNLRGAPGPRKCIGQNRFAATGTLELVVTLPIP